MEDRAAKKTVSFDLEGQMDIDERFQQLAQPMYKGKRIDDPIPSPVVSHCLSFQVISDIVG